MKPDSIGVEVIRAALNAAAERMRITMIKTAYNHIISESLDFGCAIFDPDVQMIAQGIGLPVFQGHLGFPIEATIRDRGRWREPRGTERGRGLPMMKRLASSVDVVRGPEGTEVRLGWDLARTRRA